MDMEMHFSAGVVFTWGGFGVSSWTRGWFDALFSFVSGEVTPNSFTQWGRFKNRNVPCTRPSWGEAWALLCCPPAGAQAVPCSCGFCPAPGLARGVQLQRAPRGSARDARAVGEKEWQGELSREKTSVSSSGFCFVPSLWHLHTQIFAHLVWDQQSQVSLLFREGSVNLDGF